MNRSVKELLGQVHSSDGTPESDDGLDAAFLWFDNASQTLSFAGARMALHVLPPAAEQMETLAGQRVGVGYVDSAIDYQWPVSRITLAPASLVFIATDGLTDQIGRASQEQGVPHDSGTPSSAGDRHLRSPATHAGQLARRAGTA